MLFWEALDASRLPRMQRKESDDHIGQITVETMRLPYDSRCCAKAKSGGRCRGRILPGSEFCLFHDPRMTAERRRGMAAKAASSRKRFSHLPDGYLRKLTSLSAVGEAMDRLYREVRLGVITPEMGDVLFRVLTRMMDSGLVKSGPKPERTKAAHVRPKLRELLTRSERMAWNRAVAHAETSAAKSNGDAAPLPNRTLKPSFDRVVAQRSAPRATVPGPISFPAAS